MWLKLLSGGGGTALFGCVRGGTACSAGLSVTLKLPPGGLTHNLPNVHNDNRWNISSRQHDKLAVGAKREAGSTGGGWQEAEVEVVGGRQSRRIRNGKMETEKASSVKWWDEMKGERKADSTWKRPAVPLRYHLVT